MKRRSTLPILALFLLAGAGIMRAEEGIQKKYLPSEKEFYLNEADMAFLQPGLQLKIQKVEISGSDVSVTFRISDNQDKGLDRLGVDTPGPVTFGFILARIKPGDTQYSIYTFRPYSSSTRGAITIPWTDTPEGTYASLGDGVYKYTFNTKLPSNFEADSTHTLGIQASRDLRTLAEQLGLLQLVKTGRYVANATLNFVPSGKEVTQVRDVVRVEACNQCHNPLAVHGGSRRDTKLCILCHQPQNIDIYNPSVVADFKVMIHKIHMGANLPSVTGKSHMNILGTSGSGTGTTFTGATQGPMEEDFKPVTPYLLACSTPTSPPPCSNFSTVVWPQDVRNCTTCHQGGTQSDNYKTNPTRAACGSCHDNVNFATGENHPGGVQLDNSLCSICHPADTGLEFDLSVAGVHTIPGDSKQLKGLKLEITGVTNTNPGDKPTVAFKVSDGKGNPVDATKLTSLSFDLAGPTDDYTFVTRGAPAAGNPTGSPAAENALPTVKATSTGFTYTFNTALPANAKGTFSVGAFANRLVTIPGSLVGQSFNVQEYIGINPVFYFGVGGAKTIPRRQVVSVEKCNVCHKKLALHGGPRRNPAELCQACHNPANVDQPDQARAAGFNVPAGTAPQSINFRFMIHRIHTGEELTRDFTIYRGFGVFGYNGLRFPGDRRDCEKCHLGPGSGPGVARTYDLPLPAGLANAVAPREFFSPLGPAASACLGCHDSEDAAAHAFLQTAIFPSGKASESCPVCHEEGAEFAVTRVHAR